MTGRATPPVDEGTPSQPTTRRRAVARRSARVLARVGLRMAISAALAGAGIACGAPGSATRSTATEAVVRVGMPSEPRTLVPALALTVSEGVLADLLFDRLATPAPDASPFGDRAYTPGLATSWRWSRGGAALTFTLDTAARWHDGAAVTSADVRFTFDVLRDRRIGARAAGAAGTVDSVTTPDVRTAIVWCHRASPTLFHDLTVGTHILPAHLLDTIPRTAIAQSPFARHPVGSGAFRFVRWEPGVAIVLTRDATRRRAAAGVGGLGDAAGDGARPVQAVVVRFLPGYDAALAALQSGDVDVLGYLRPDDAARVARRPELVVRTGPGYDYVDLMFNLRRDSGAARGAGRRSPENTRLAAFGDPDLRRALAMAVDRRALTANLLGPYGHVALGPVTRAMAIADTIAGSDPAPAFDRDLARRALDQAGWRTGADGVRRRGGVPLAFSILVPASSASRRQAAVELQAMFAAVGARTEVRTLDPAAFQAALERGDFDAALQGIRADPSPAQLRDIWSTRAGRREGGTVSGFNFGGYADPAVDALLDSAGSARTPSQATKFYRRAWRAIVRAVPAIFLYEPEAAVAFNRRVSTGDLAPSAWWTGLARWKVRTATGAWAR